MEYSLFLAKMLLVTLIAVSEATKTVDFSVQANGDTTVDLPCPDNTVVAIDDLTVSSDGASCRLNAFRWVVITYLGKSGGVQIASGADLSPCVNNEVVTITYSCVASSQVINICDIGADQDTVPGSAVYLHSPSFPGQYSRDLDCRINFGLNVTLTYKAIFVDVDKREDSPGCYDKLVFFTQLGLLEQREIGSVCATQQFGGAGLVVSENTNLTTLSITFESDSGEFNTQHDGFLIRIDPLNIEQTSTTSTSMTSTSTGTATGTATTSTTTITTTTTTMSPTGTPSTTTIDPTDDCHGVVCMSGGTCIDDFNSYACECRLGYTGTHCQDITCNPNPCQNGAICRETGPAMTCVCTTGYRGDYCEENVQSSSSPNTLLSTTTLVTSCLVTLLITLRQIR